MPRSLCRAACPVALINVVKFERRFCLSQLILAPAPTAAFLLLLCVGGGASAVSGRAMPAVASRARAWSCGRFCQGDVVHDVQCLAMADSTFAPLLDRPPQDGR
eukprot:2376229-Pleurochrysis_carterae.AAC.1